ncbi:IQ domain-containing protein M [Phyllostomus hastatus]|uniref:IQ domain-containing protein M n=1 Tax=Phyllostomus hastatus TaxID=9423 RepID=UPI001E68026C|nr:IQ domain-containing protein M [Phyllostomus hastatus]
MAPADCSDSSVRAVSVPTKTVLATTRNGEVALLGLDDFGYGTPPNLCVLVSEIEMSSPVLEITKQDFFQEAKNLIAQHYEKINDNKVQGSSINVFRNKHQKPKSVQFLPLEIKNKETLDVAQECQTAHRHTGFPKDVSKGDHPEAPPQPPSFKEPRMFNVKEKFMGSIDLIAKEQVKLCKIVTNIESVGKKMEKEKQRYHGKSRLPSGYAVLQCLQVSVEPLDYAKSPEMQWPSDSEKGFMKKEKIAFKPEPEPQHRVQPSPPKMDKLDSKVKRIGPHIEIFQVFRKRNKLIFTKKVIRMITVLQAHIRGWLERKRLRRIVIKALYHGRNLRAVINIYCRLIHRVKYRLGLWRTRQIINFTELEEWMDRKKFYETMFAKREDWQGLQKSELLKYFNDCGHFPIQQQIDHVWNLVHREDHEKYSEIIKKPKAIEMLFTLYPPQGAHVQNNMRLRSTWLRPIVDGEEGYKYIVSGHPVLKRANIRIVGRLVATYMRERKMRQQQAF